MAENRAYSYHTFMFPFMCINSYKSVYGVFDNDSSENIWYDADACFDSNSLRVIKADKRDENRDYYDSYKFFNEAGRNLIFYDRKTDNVRCYEIKKERSSRLFYVIGKADSEYRLPIKNISLKFYSTGIIVFTLCCINEEYRSIDDVKAINEYGRRLGLPYWPAVGEKCEKCADYLKIVKISDRGNDEKDGIYEDILSADFFTDVSEGKNDISLSYISTVIRQLLNRNGSGYCFRGKPTKNKKQIQMKALLEEKMYVASLIIDREYSERLYRDYINGGGNFSTKEKRSLLELCRGDTAGKCSINNNEELDEYIRNHLYLTGFSEESGKLMAVTDQAYIKIIPEADYDEEYYLSAYVPLIVIPVVQRNSIALFQQRIADTTNSTQKKITTSTISEILSLQREYVIFQNHYLLANLTVQKEGRFLYGKLREELSIAEEKEVLDSQVGRLFELANIQQGYSFNKWALYLSLIALISSGFAYIVTAKEISEIDFYQFRGWFILIVTLIVMVLSLLIIQLTVFRKTENRRKK